MCLSSVEPDHVPARVWPSNEAPQPDFEASDVTSSDGCGGTNGEPTRRLSGWLHHVKSDSLARNLDPSWLPPFSQLFRYKRLEVAKINSTIRYHFLEAAESASNTLECLQLRSAVSDNVREDVAKLRCLVPRWANLTCCEVPIYAQVYEPLRGYQL